MLDKIKQIEDIIRIYKEQGQHAIYKEFQAALHRIVESEGFKVVESDEYEELLDDSLFLNCLRNTITVDNCDWYSEAVEEYQQIKGEE
jgi:hypothetical protein